MKNKRYYINNIFYFAYLYGKINFGVSMKLKKIYLEITNRCNLSCPFCIKNQRPIKDLSKEEYQFIINKIKNYTKELYLHVLGEPLIHPDINYFINYAKENNLLVNITTNGYLINNIKDNHNIHKLNISLHSFNENYHVDFITYLNNIFNVIDNLKDKTYITIRLWIKNKYTSKILEYINKRYNTNITDITDNSKLKITNNILIDTFHEFIWPDLNNNYYSEEGSCMGLKNHIGILSDGTIIPCCLDSLGIINLGNIFSDKIVDIFNKDKVKKMINGFNNNKKVEELCKHCHFLEVKNENIKLEKQN